ncbi:MULTISPECIES: LysR family transcriptional regulator [Vibrio]|uniref:LysR family transcriptional regulator n=1 Tax=Vibrio ostreae TaxID=2841925 RepID=A0A975U7Q0_9VIBR|nr:MULTISPECIES: LysR family transcriptional regulator [Vibrio]QXO16101.1 LysR family transcriptional regulator [Vibrio ostreae]WGY44875.1 LysR family transcriptional regulator [Vibrio sp. ABG19]
MDRLQCDRMFVAVMELGSFARAAQRLNISSGQASKLISRLEQDLGVQLFKRSTRSLAPTEVGQAYYERIKRIVDDLDELDDSIRNASRQPSGRLRIAAPVTFGQSQLAPCLIDFSTRYPEIDLDVRFSDRSVNIVEEGFDLALRIGQLTDSSLIARKLCDVRVLTLASAQYLSQYGTPQHWRELASHNCIIDTNFRDPFRWPYINAQQIVEEMPVNGRLKFSNADVCLEAACAGLGIARLPTFVAAAAIRRNKLVPILSDYEVPPIGLFALYPPAKHLAQSSRAFIDFLVARFAAGPTWE